MKIDRNLDISKALHSFSDYTLRKLFRIDKDTAQLLTGEMFQGGEAGMSVPETVCTAKSVGISVDVNAYELHLLAGTMAHMIGHNIGMGHDGGREECFCRDWHGCIMAQSIVGLENVQPYKFSECSRSDYNSALRTGHGICLLNKPNEFVTGGRTCGNNIIEEGEDCDCGTVQECQEFDPCCDPYTCKLRKEAECATGPCCVGCKLKSIGVVCRESKNECDLPEHCTGEHGQCPPDVYKKNGNPCASDSGYCFNGVCPTLDIQCEQIWGYGGIAGDTECFKQFNSKGSLSGHCGTDSEKQYIKCDSENARCGSLQCQMGSSYPMVAGVDQHYSRTIISMKGVEYECKTTSAPMDQGDSPDLGLVRDGTPCGDNLICINQTCTSIYPHVDQGRCPSNHNNLECSGHGVCSNVNKCYCSLGWSGPDCSIQVEIAISPSPENPPDSKSSSSKNDLESQMNKKETPYENSHSTNTVFLVGTLMSVVGGVFITFALMALCYRSVVVHKNFSLCLRKSTMPKYDPPYVKKPIAKAFNSSSQATPEEPATMENANKITFANIPSYSGRDARVFFRPMNHMGGSGLPTSRFQDHKMQQMKRLGVGSGSEEDPTHSGEEESVSFIDLPPNNLAKLPEKGILKKPCPYGADEPCLKGKWLEDAQQENQDMQSENTLNSDIITGGPISEVERTLKSLNGYHEDILEALRTAASHHRGGGGASSTTGSSSSEDLLRRSLAAAVECSYNRVNSQDKLCDPTHGSQTHVVMVENSSPSPSGHHHHRRSNHRTDTQADDDEDDDVPPCGPIRIRNLEDLIRQLEHKTTRHMSPSGSEDIRMSETEADRHYNRLDSQGGRVRSRDGGEFMYGRYRHSGPGGQRGGASGYLPEEEGIYESADQDRGPPLDTPDSESDDFIQAQRRLVRSANDDEEGDEEEDEGEDVPSPPPPESPDSSPNDDQSALIRGTKYPEYKH
ncbi:hypothetical protein AAG570_009864 [Ranatra chinensis]|uniref:Uncharacterized protein n=1 Tax=Ranatra chinensis TaxID=642074 RepID=A0ABD0Z3A9_9HEMI